MESLLKKVKKKYIHIASETDTAHNAPYHRLDFFLVIKWLDF